MEIEMNGESVTGEEIRTLFHGTEFRNATRCHIGYKQYTPEVRYFQSTE